MSYIDEYLKYLKEVKGLSYNTLLSYERDVRHFTEYLESKNKFIPDVKRRNVVEFLNVLKGEGKKDSTISRYLASIKSFYQFLLLTDRVSISPVASLHAPHVERKLPVYLEESEIKKLIRQPIPNTVSGIRDKAMITMLCNTGIRVSELIMIDRDDIRMKSGRVIVRNERREVIMNKETKKALRNYMMTSRPVLDPKNDKEALFLNMRGNRITRQGCWKLLKKYGMRADIEKDITPHILRHSLAVRLIREGQEPADIQRLFGYSDISSTQIYRKLVENNVE
jgi:integrase/recombinase XerD